MSYFLVMTPFEPAWTHMPEVKKLFVTAGVHYKNRNEIIIS